MSTTWLHKLKQANKSVNRAGDRAGLRIDATQVSNELKKEFRKLDALAKIAVTTKVKDAMVGLAGPVLAAVKTKTPEHPVPIRRFLDSGRLAAVYEPGNLRKSMKVFKGGLNNTNAPAIFIGPATERDVGRELEDDGYYAYFLIKGTKNIKADNFILDAQKIMEPYIKQVIGKAAADAVEKRDKKEIMKVKLTKAYKKFKKGTELDVTNNLAKELQEGGFLTQNKTRKSNGKKKNLKQMKVQVINSWCHPVNGRIMPNGAKLDIDPRWFNAAFLKKVTPRKKKVKE